MPATLPRVTITPISGNGKTGPLTTTRSERATCPSTCPFYGAGCYARAGRERIQWDRLDRGDTGMLWSEFLTVLRRTVPTGALWRHNTAGDLPHDGGTIDAAALQALTAANRGRRGFTYTHHTLTPANVQALQDANAAGFTVNASTESIEAADRVMAQHGIPAVAVVPSTESRRFFRTASGRRVIVCPAALHPGKVTCASCGLCQRADRDAVIAFPAHGVSKRRVDAIVSEG